MDDTDFNTVSVQPTDRTDRDDFSFDSNLSSNLSSPASLSPDNGNVVKVHHARYFIKDDMTVFLVNGILFRVHRHYLDRESDIFRSYPSGTEDDPIPLPGVLPEEFEALVEYFYDSVHGNISRSSNQWIHLLSVSTRFKMEKVRQRAITELEIVRVDPVEKIVVAVKHDVPAWLEPAYVEMYQRAEPIREEEAERLGLSTAMKLARAREYVRDPVWVHQNPAPAPSPPRPVKSIGWDEWNFRPPSPVDLTQNPGIPPSPIDKRLDTAHVKRVVRLIFWSHLPSVTPERNASLDYLVESDGESPNMTVSNKKGKKRSKR